MLSFSSFKFLMSSPPVVRFYMYPAYAADTAVNPNGIKMLLANGLRRFFIKDNSGFSNSPRSLPRNPPDCTI